MRIGRIRRLHFSWHFYNRVMWLGICAAMAAGIAPLPVCAQGPSGAAAAAAGAGAAASAAAPAPAPKKDAAAAATDAAAMGNSAVAPPPAAHPAPPPANTEEAANGNAPPPAAEAPEPVITGTLPKGVAAQCANLLHMATNLKAAVDRTTKDVLSVAVIRDADQIAQTARKMREAQH